MAKEVTTRQEIKEKEAREMKPVLIIEDENIMRESLRDWLKDEGYEVETAKEGEEALEKIGKKEFSVAVLDLRLPGKDGLEVLREATEKDPKIKGIVITAYPSVETAVEAMKTGAVDYIVKPFSIKVLKTRAFNLIKQRQMLREKFSRELLSIEPQILTNNNLVLYNFLLYCLKFEELHQDFSRKNTLSMQYLF